jgi:hypothetical protein
MFLQYYAQALAGKSPNETPKQHTRKVFLVFISLSLPWRNFSDQEAYKARTAATKPMIPSDTLRLREAAAPVDWAASSEVDEAPDSKKNNVSIEFLNTGAQELTTGIGGSGRCAALRAVRRAVR